MKPVNIFLTISIVAVTLGFTISNIRESRDPLTPIIHEVIRAQGDPYGAELDNLTRWFSMDVNRALAVRIAQQCAEVGNSLRIDITARWSNSTEAKVCKAAVLPASVGILNNHYRAEN